jgi:hypothetical protein
LERRENNDPRSRGKTHSPVFVHGAIESDRAFNFSPGEAREDLGIRSEETFTEGFAKVCRKLNLGWDETFRVLYLPTWWKYNCPENPNVLKSCLADLHEIPQTQLIAEFSRNLVYLPETFHRTFREGLAKPSPQRMPHLEQEKEQEQESVRAEPSPTHDLDSNVKEFLDRFAKEYQRRFETPYHPARGKDEKIVKDLLCTYTLEQLREKARLFFASQDPWIRDNGGYTIGVFNGQINRLGTHSWDRPRKMLT